MSHLELTVARVQFTALLPFVSPCSCSTRNRADVCTVSFITVDTLFVMLIWVLCQRTIVTCHSGDTTSISDLTGTAISTSYGLFCQAKVSDAKISASNVVY